MSEGTKIYEICYLLTSSGTEQEIVNVLNQQQSEILHQEALKEARLAYPIKKQQTANFGFIHFVTLPENVNKIKAALALNAGILRLLIISFSADKIPEKKVSVRSQQPDSKPLQVGDVKIAKPDTNILSNEALEKKIEEILK